MFDELYEKLNRVDEEVATVLVAPQKLMKDYFKGKSTKLTLSTWPSSREEHEYKFWLLQDGTVIPVEYSHTRTVNVAGNPGGYSDRNFMETGAVAGAIHDITHEMTVQASKKLTKRQIFQLRNLGIEYKVVSIVAEIGRKDWQSPVKSSNHLDYLLNYGPDIDEAKAVDDKEKLDYFLKRMHLHIGLVQKAAAKIAEAYPEEFGELIKQTADHDASKLKDPELTPYVAITWRHKLEKEEGKFDPIKGKGYQTPGRLEKKDEDDATLHHIKNNTHHPEFWLDDKLKANLGTTNRDDSIECVDATKMDAISVAEMIADWQAMAEELKTNTAREWFNKVSDERWHFSDDQKELIDRLLKVFEDSSVVDEAKHSHSRCMTCSKVPEVEALWAEGRGHVWFCLKHFKEWATKGDGKGDVDAVKKIQDGKASKKWGDNTSPNIINSMKFL